MHTQLSCGDTNLITGSDEQMNKNFQCTILNIFLPIILTYVLSAQKNCLIEHNICFG